MEQEAGGATEAVELLEVLVLKILLLLLLPPFGYIIRLGLLMH